MSQTVADPVAVIRQHEMKFIIRTEQADALRVNLREHMSPDCFGRTSVASLYYDTPDRRLIRASVEKPPFKEKIRLRSYGLATDSSPVFLEIKRKFKGEVYKRRIQTTVPQAEAFFLGRGGLDQSGQISRELIYFRDYYQALVPACLIIAERTAFLAPDDALRLTFDEAPRFRTDDLTLTHSMDGTLLLPEDSLILEIKAQRSLPLWLTSLLSEAQIYQGSFSKYGAAYQRLLADDLPERIAYHV